MPVSQKKKYIESNPRFELTQPGSRPTLQKGQMTIIYECLEKLGSPRLTELARCCEANGYRDRFKSETNTKKSILYHLKRMREGTIGRVKHAQRQIVHEL